MRTISLKWFTIRSQQQDVYRKVKLTSFSFLKLIPMEDSGNELQPNSLLAIKSGLNIRLDIKCSTCLIYARNSPSPIVLKILLCINYFVLFKYK